MKKPKTSKSRKRRHVTITLPPEIYNSLKDIYNITNGKYDYYSRFIEDITRKELKKYDKHVGNK